MGTLGMRGLFMTNGLNVHHVQIICIIFNVHMFSPPGFLLYDTQRIIRNAEHHPNSSAVQQYDPINA